MRVERGFYGTGRAFGRLEKGGAEEGSVLIVKGGLEVGAVGPEVFEGRVDGEQVMGFLRGNGGHPGVVFLTETQAERGMALDKGAEGTVQGFRIGTGAEGEEEGLIPVMGVG